MNTVTSDKKEKNFSIKKVMGFVFGGGIPWVLLAFFIPSIIMLMGFMDSEIHPYGDNQMLVVDLWHQYYPFFKVVREKLVSGGSFFYTWSTGMGTNFLSLISYYAMSPLNWISALFSDEKSRDVMMYLLTAKIGFCGMFFSLFLRYTFKRNDASISVFGTLYALSSYMLGYYWNVMWFDTVALFPLVMLGVVAICREGKWKLFTISLALSLISNYYVGYFTCIFTVIAFIVGIICEGRSVGDYFKKLWIIARSAAIGIALGGFILLPAYNGLQLAFSANNTFPENMEFYEKWTDIFANTLSFSPPAMKEGLPNFACGMLPLVLLGVFLITPKIRIREKIAGVLVLAFIAVSCNMNILNYIWHGFHFTNMIPYRFAFIFSFVLITIAYRALDTMLTNGVKIYQIIAMPIIPAVVIYLNKIAKSEEFELAMKWKKNFIRDSIIISCAFIAVFILVKFIPKKFRNVTAYVTSIALGFFVCSEGLANAKLGVKTVGNSSYVSYPDRYENVEELLNNIDEQESDLFYRTEMRGTYTLNDGSLYGYNGVSQFSSSANVSVTKFMKKLGIYGSEAGNRYYYRISSPVTNAFLGIKYLVSKSGEFDSEQYALERLDGIGYTVSAKNKFALPLGFMVDENIKIADAALTSNPFEYQNELVKNAVGMKENIFSPQPVALADYGNVEMEKLRYGSYNYRKTENLSESISLSYDPVENASLYGYIANDSCDDAYVSVDDVNVESGISIKEYSVTFPMGNPQPGQRSTLKLNLKSEASNGYINAVVYALDHELWEKAYSLLADEPFNITEFSDTDIKGNVTALNDGIMYFSIPYEKGWSVYVDGEKAESEKLMNAMLGVKLSKGCHDIELKYVPDGFKVGAYASAGGVFLFIFFAAVDAFISKRRKKKAVTADEADESILPDSEIADIQEEIPVADKASEEADADTETIETPEIQEETSETESVSEENSDGEADEPSGDVLAESAEEVIAEDKAEDTENEKS